MNRAEAALPFLIHPPSHITQCHFRHQIHGAGGIDPPLSAGDVSNDLVQEDVGREILVVVLGNLTFLTPTFHSPLSTQRVDSKSWNQIVAHPCRTVIL